MKKLSPPPFLPVAAFILINCSLFAQKTEKLVIYQTSDIHSTIEGNNSGWLNLAANIRNHRKALGIVKENSLLIDCGDTIPGSIIGTLTKGKAASAILNTLGYDAWILGNHDLEFGYETLEEIAKNSNFDIISANLVPIENNCFSNWKLYKKNNVRIAVIGLTSPYIDEWLWGEKRKQYKLIPPISTIEKLMPEILNSKPDVIILAIHHGRFSPKRLKGFNIEKIAKRFPEIDLILGGHSHQEIPGEKCGISSWYVETGCHAEKYACIEITVAPADHKVIEIKSRLIPVKNVERFDSDLEKALEKFRKQADIFSKEKVGYTEKSISPPLKKELFASINELFCQAITSASKANIAFHGSVMKSVRFKEIITEQDVFDAIPYEDSLCTLDLNSKEIKLIINEQILKKEKDRFQSPFGIKIFIDRNNRISLTDENGEKLDKSKRYKCAFSSYALAGAGGRFPELKRIAMLKTSKGKDTGQTIRDALRKYIKANSPLNIEIIKRIHYGN